MKTFLIIFLCLFLFIGCGKNISIDEVLSDFKISLTEIPADGQSTVNLSVVLSEKSSTDRRKVIFSTSSGMFISSGKDKDTANAEFENGILIAKDTLKSSTQPGTIKVTVQPEYDSPLKEFVLEESIIAKPSLPVSIKLEPSSYGIASNFLNEVKITGILKNSSGNFVSKGYNVFFEDVLVIGVPANGHFRCLKTSTSDSSKVSGYYSTISYPIGTQIKIRSTILDATGLRTSIADSIILTINK